MKSTIEYSIGKYQVRVNIWLLILFLIMQTLLNELGFWQLNRAKEKQIRLHQIEQGGQSKLDSLSSVEDKHLLQFQQVNLSLEALYEKATFLDNKTHKKAPGYHVLQLAKEQKSGKYVLVNRGWVFGGKDRNLLPQIDLPKSPWQVSGRLYPITTAPSTALQGEVENMSEGVRVPNIDLKTLKVLEETYRLPLEPYLVRIDADDESALDVDWQWTNMPVEKHLAYAVQWFGLALALLIISLIVAVKKKKVS